MTEFVPEFGYDWKICFVIEQNVAFIFFSFLKLKHTFTCL